MKRYMRLDDGTLLDINDTTILISEVQIDGDSVSQRAYGSGSNYYMMSDKEFASITHESDNILDLVRVGDMLEAQGVEYVDYIKVNDYDDIRHIQNAIKNNNISAIVAIWFRSGDTMKRVEVVE